MFLSDQLIEIGRQANPKSNLSQATQANKMLILLNTANKVGEPKQKLENITKFVVKQLNKEGFSFYTYNTFWKIEI